MMYTPALGAAIAGLVVADAGGPGVRDAPAPPVLSAPAPPLPPPSPSPPRPSLLAPIGPVEKNAKSDSYQLRRAKDGSGDLTYDGPAFSARVSVDGGVAFRDHPVQGLTAVPPILPAPVDNGIPSLQWTLSSVLRGKKPPPVRPDVTPDESFLIIPMTSRYRPNPLEGCRTCGFIPDIKLFSVAGKADLTDALMRMSGEDPYRLEKARFLTATRDLRIKMAAQAHAVWVRKAAADLPGRLEAIACDDRLSVTERRAVLEALANEMDESPSGRAAANRIAAFVQARFGPETSSPPDAGAVCPATLPRP